MGSLLKIFLFTSVFLLLLFSCRKDQLEIKQTTDPCDCASEVSADFDILERHLLAGSGELIVTDHVFGRNGKEVRFRAKQDDAEYTWYIGSEIENKKETFKVFGLQWIGSTIPITLVVKKEPNLICFPNDDGYDSISKTFNIYESCHEPYLLEGIFRMASENSTDSIDITIEFKEYAPWNDCRNADITNFDGVGSVCPGNYFRVSKSYRYMHSPGSSSGSCQSLGGGFSAWHHLDGICEMKYRYYENNDISTQVDKHLFGRKIN
jgi:hypothetical protein